MNKIISVLLICVMLTLTFSPIGALAEYDPVPFTDLGHGFSNGYLSVKSLVEKGIVSGKYGKFYPNDPVTREEAAKIIVLATKAPLVSKTGSFTDVVSDSWYEVYVESALSANLMTGTGGTVFGVGSYITRQDAAVLVARMAEYLGVTIEQIKDVTVSDLNSVADYAKSAVVSLLNMNIAEFKTSSQFAPTQNITRFDFCKIIDRALISDVDYYDDYLTDWMPKDIDVTNLTNEVIAFDDFEGSTTTLNGFYVKDPSAGTAKNYITRDMGKNSTSSLRLKSGVNPTNNINLILNNVDPSVEYLITYDIKTENLSENAYVRVNYQWLNSEYKEVGGTYEMNNDVKENIDWTQHLAMPGVPTPDLAPEMLRIVIYLNRVANSTGEISGTVYLDNLKIYKLVYEPVTTYLKSPAYKGLITEPNGESDIRLTTYIKGIDTLFSDGEYKLEAEILGLENRNSYAKSVQRTLSDEMDISFSSKKLPIGDYDLSVKMTDESNGKVVGENHWVIRKRAENFTSKYRFDEYGRLLKNGEPHFPIGTYSLGLNYSDMEDFKDSAIDFFIANSTSSFWENNSVFSKMREYGIESMLSTENIYKNAFRGQYQSNMVTNIASERAVLENMINDLNLPTEEAHIGYQINNEFPAGKWGSRMTWQHQILSEIDFEHLTYGVGVGGEQAAIDYARCHDIYACDVYPIKGEETDQIWKVYEDTKGLVDGTVGKPVWTVLQVSDLRAMGREPYSSYKRGPSETELRNMAWQAVCGGAQGIIWYAHFHLGKAVATDEDDFPFRPKSETLPEMLRVSKEVDDYSNVILSREDAPNVKLTATDSSKFAHLVRRYNGKTYVFMVNMSKETQNVSLYLEGATSVQGKYSGNNYTIANSGKTDLSLAGLGVEILVVDQDERPSSDCELKNVHLYDENNNNYFIVKDGETNNIYLPAGVDNLYYNVDIHHDARVIVNGCPNKTKGSMSLEGKDKIRFTVIAEDGQNFEQHWYNIVRI